MMLPDALHGWAPSFGQWCSFAISSLRWTGSTYLFRGRFNSVEAIAVRLELLHRFADEFRGGEDGDVVLPPRAEMESIRVRHSRSRRMWWSRIRGRTLVVRRIRSKRDRDRFVCSS